MGCLETRGENKDGSLKIYICGISTENEQASQACNTDCTLGTVRTCHICMACSFFTLDLLFCSNHAGKGKKLAAKEAELAQQSLKHGSCVHARTTKSTHERATITTGSTRHYPHAIATDFFTRSICSEKKKNIHLST